VAREGTAREAHSTEADGAGGTWRAREGTAREATAQRQMVGEAHGTARGHGEGGHSEGGTQRGERAW